MNRPVPLYRQVADTLRAEIATMEPNAVLPSEHDLGRRFGVSRITVRLALGLLERAGIVTRQRGRGTIGSPSKVARHILPVRTLEQDLHEQGLKLETTVLSYDRAVRPPEPIRGWLGLRGGERAARLWLLRAVDGRIICHDERYLPPGLAARFEPELARQASVTEIIQELAGLPVADARWETEIAPARGDVAEVLQVAPGVLVLTNTFVERFAGGAPANAGVTSYRIDRVKFLFAASGSAIALPPLPARRAIPGPPARRTSPARRARPPLAPRRGGRP